MTAGGAGRARVPEWLPEVARPARAPVPWALMAFAALSIGVPFAAGLAAGQPTSGVLAAVGGLVGAMVGRSGPYPLRMRRIAVAGVFGGTAGLLVGAAVHGWGWLAVGVLVAVAGVSALLSSISATGSMTGLYLLAYAALATGPLGAFRPLWLLALWPIAGVCWSLLLLVPGWVLHPRTPEQLRVAAVFRAVAAELRALGTENFSATGSGVVAALNVAYEELLSQRAAARGRDQRLTRLVSLLNQARLAAEASVALGYEEKRLPSEAAAQAEALAEAVTSGGTVPEIALPGGVTPALRALYRALNGAANILCKGSAVLPIWAPQRRVQLRALAEEVRLRVAFVYALRLMLCVGVAAVFSEVLPLQRSYWVVLAVAFVMKPDLGSVFARALQYGAGTVIGAVAGGLILAAGPPDAVLLAPVVVLAGLLPYGMSLNYGLFAVFVSPLIIMLIEALSHGGWPLAEARLIDVLLGCGIALGIGYAPWPSSWHVNLPRDFARAVDQAADYLVLAFSESPPGAAATAHARARRDLAGVQTEFQRALGEPQRVRRRVMAWWPAAVALEQLLNAVTAAAVTTADESPPVTAVTDLSAPLRQVAAAARSGDPVRQEGHLPEPPSLERVTDAVRCIQRSLTGASYTGGSPPARPS